MKQPGDPEDRSETEAGPDQAEPGEEAGGGGESRRDFIKKLPYVAPAIETFLLEDTVYAKTEKKKPSRRRRRRRRISPVPGELTPVPPPPPAKKDEQKK